MYPARLEPGKHTNHEATEPDHATSGIVQLYDVAFYVQLSLTTRVPILINAG